MSEHKIPIPSMIYNAAVGGHVTNSQQIIDEVLNKEQSILNIEQQELNKGILEEKEYTSGSNNGMGRVVLRKNLVNGVNNLTQNMINKSNTIYVIQYDFTLGEDITVPENCVLEFDGGSLSGNGTGKDTITGNNTKIEAQNVAIFNNGIIIAGNWICPKITNRWFDNITVNNRVRQLFNLCNDNIYNEVYIEEGTYHLTISYKYETPIRLNNTKLHLDGTIQVDPSHNIEAYQTVGMSSNSTIVGKGKIIGDESGLPIGEREHCFGIIIGDESSIKPNNVYIDGIEISNFDGDGIYVRHVKDVYLKNMYIHNVHRQGIALEDVSNITVYNCIFENILQEGSSYAAIDIEPEVDGYIVSNLTIKKCTFNKCNQAIILSDTIKSVPINIRIEDCVINNTIKGSLELLGGDSIFIINNYIDKHLGSRANNMYCLNNRFIGNGNTIISNGQNCYIKNNIITGNSGRYGTDIVIYGTNNFIEGNYIESGENTENLFHINLAEGSKNCVVVNNLSKPILTGTDAGYTKENIHNEGTDNFIGTNYYTN